MNKRLKIVADSHIPFLNGVFEPYADVVYIDGLNISRQDVRDADALIIRTRTKCNEALLGDSHVSMIATATIGTDHIDFDFCRSRGIEVHNSQGCNAGGVMQYVFSALYGTASRKSIKLDHPVMGIVGVGNVGKKVEHMARYLGFEVLRCDPPRAEAEGPEGFCSLDALDAFSINYNELEEFPNIFSSDESNIIMTSISVAHNNIKSLPADFNGVRVVTLTLTGNPISVFPKELAETDSYVEVLAMQSCGMNSFPEDCLDGENTSFLTTIDLQFNNLTDIPDDFSANSLPYLSGMDVSCNSFSEFPLEPLNILRLTAFGIRGQRNASGERCLSDWPEGLSTHTGLRGFYIGSNDLRLINDDISYLIFYLDISDNPNIIFDATDVCSAWQAGQYFLYYDRTQDIIGCDAMLD